MFHLVTLPREQGETLIYLFKYNRGMGTQQNRRHTSTDTETVSGGQFNSHVAPHGTQGWVGGRSAATREHRRGGV